MAYFFVLLFFVAVAGIFKPYINGLNRKHFAIGAVASFVAIGVTAPKAPETGEKPAAAMTEAENVDATPNRAVSGTAPILETKWSYNQSRDEMRGTTTKLASVRSNNEVDLDFPYGVVGAELWVRRRPEDGLNVVFQVDKGQVLCHSFSDSYVSMKFDDGPIQRFTCTSASDGSSETAFIENAGRALAALKKAKRTIIEAEFYQQGRQQFIFDTAGLKWE